MIAVMLWVLVRLEFTPLQFETGAFQLTNATQTQVEFTPLELETKRSCKMQSKSRIYQNLLRWSLKHAISNEDLTTTILEFTPLEFETRGVGNTKNLDKNQNLLRWSLKQWIKKQYDEYIAHQNLLRWSLKPLTLEEVFVVEINQNLLRWSLKHIEKTISEEPNTSIRIYSVGV